MCVSPARVLTSGPNFISPTTTERREGVEASRLREAGTFTSAPSRGTAQVPHDRARDQPQINKKVILKECKKKFNCNGTIVEDPELGQIVQLQGDQRKLVAQFLIDEKIAKKDVIKVHGS